MDTFVVLVEAQRATCFSRIPLFHLHVCSCLGGSYTLNLTGKQIQLKTILIYLDINNSDQFWQPVTIAL